MAVASSALTIFSLASTGFTAWGQAQEGEERASTEQFNADILRQKGKIVKARSRLNILRQRKEAKTVMSTQQALYSKAGVALTGSPLQVIEESAANAELDILITEFNTLMEVSRLESEAQEKVRLAKAEKRMGRVRAGKTLLEAVSQFGGIGGGSRTKFESIGSHIGVRK